MRDVLIALAPDWFSFRNAFLKAPAKKKLSSFAGIVAFLFFSGLIGTGAARVTTFARDTFGDYPEVLRLIEINVLSAVSLAAFILLFMTGVRGIYGAFYESGDLPFLLATPLKVEAVFFAKLQRNIVSNFLVLLPFSGVVWMGYGAAYGAGVGFYIISLLALMLVASMFTSLSSLLVMVIMRYVPGQKLKQMILVISLLVSLVFVIGIQYLNSTINLSDDPGQTRALLESAGTWQLDRMGYLPHVWLTKTLLTFAGSYEFGLLESLVPMLVVGLVSVFAAFVFARYTFLTGWSSSQESEGGRRRARPGSAALSRRGAVADQGTQVTDRRISSFDGPPGVLRGMLRKDLKFLLRTPTMWYSIAVVIVVMGFMTFNLIQENAGRGVESGEIEFTKVLLLFMTMMMSASVNARSGAVSVSLEGHSWWLIQGMPIEPGAYYMAKLMYGFLSGSAIGLLIVIGMTLVPGVPAYPLYISIPTVIAVGFVLTAISLVLDILYPDFGLGAALEGGFGRQRNVSMGKQMTILMASVGSVALLGGVFAFPLYYGSIGVTAWMSSTVARIVSIGILAGFVILVNWVCYRLGSRKLSRMFVGVH